MSPESASQLHPVGAVLSTTGLTTVAFKLDCPQVAVLILLRLYKPRDSSNIWLAQIRILGSLALPTCGSDQQQPAAQTGLTWLCMMHHCLSVAERDNSCLLASLRETAGKVDGIVEQRCGLLFANSCLFCCYIRVGMCEGNNKRLFCKFIVFYSFTTYNNWDKIGIILRSFWTSFGTFLERLWNEIGIILGSIWASCGTFLGRFWKEIGIILGSIWASCGTFLERFWNEIGFIWGSIWIRYGTILDPFGSCIPRPRDVHWAVYGIAFPHDKGGHCNVQKPYQRQERLKTACP